MTVINLNKARKQHKKAQKLRVAEENRAQFGRTKAQKDKDTLNAEQYHRHLEGHKIDTPQD